LHRLPRQVAPRSGTRDASIGGVHWTLDLGDNLQRVLFFTGRYEPRSVDELVRRARPDDVFVDVGANIGVFSIAIGRRLLELGGTGTVVAVEPSAATRSRLESHVQRNELSRIVKIAPVAFSDSVGMAELRATLRFGVDDVGTASLSGDGDVIETVELVQGRSWLTEHHIGAPQLLKVDVEGAEVATLQGLELEQDDGLRAAHIEVVDENLSDPASDRPTIFDLMSSVGLKGYWCNARGLTPASVADARSGNVLFVRSR
jgi:FkbM family methyltransferase